MVTITVEMSADEYVEFCAKNPTLAPKVLGQNSRRRSRRTAREDKVQRAKEFLLYYLKSIPGGVHAWQIREWAQTLYTPQIQPLELAEAKKQLGVYSTQWRDEKGHRHAKWHLPEAHNEEDLI